MNQRTHIIVLDLVEILSVLLERFFEQIRLGWGPLLQLVTEKSPLISLYENQGITTGKLMNRLNHRLVPHLIKKWDKQLQLDSKEQNGDKKIIGPCMYPDRSDNPESRVRELQINIRTGIRSVLRDCWYAGRSPRPHPADSAPYLGAGRGTSSPERKYTIHENEPKGIEQIGRYDHFTITLPNKYSMTNDLHPI